MTRNQPQIDLFSQTSYFLECLFDHTLLSTGTCFFIYKNGDYYLVTNWHVVTGRNPVDKSCLRPDGAIPNKLRIKILKDQELIDWSDLLVDLHDANGNNLWLEHPRHKESVDVVALKVQVPKGSMVFDIEKFLEPFNEETAAEIKDDVFVIGFPFGIKAGGELPIWKRASIASEPDVDIDGLPKLFVDTATRPGMSGSPVIYKERRPITLGEGPPNKPTRFSRYFMQFVGVYSGRVNAEDEIRAQLGIVWKSSAVHEIISQ